MATIDINTTQKAWKNLTQILFVPRTESEYKQLVAMLASLMEIIGVLIENYEQENVPEL